MTAQDLVTMLQQEILTRGPQMPVLLELDADETPTLVPIQVSTGITSEGGKPVVYLKLTPAVSSVQG